MNPNTPKGPGVWTHPRNIRQHYLLTCSGKCQAPYKARGLEHLQALHIEAEKEIIRDSFVLMDGAMQYILASKTNIPRRVRRRQLLKG